jgi:hypothetical protein
MMEIGVAVVLLKGDMVDPSLTAEQFTRDALLQNLRVLSYNLPVAHLYE